MIRRAWVWLVALAAVMLLGAPSVAVASEEDGTPFVLAAWVLPGDVSEPHFPGQVLFAPADVATGDLSALDAVLAEACGLDFQVDLYLDDEVTAALLAGGVLNGPNNPTEHLAWGAPGLSGNPWKYVDNGPCPVEPERGVEQRTLDPVCVVPLDGTAVVVVEERTWEQYPDQERTYGPWVEVSSGIIDVPACIPEPTPTPTPTPTVTPTPEPTSTPAAVPEPELELAATGPGDEAPWLLGGALVLLAAGLGLSWLAARRRGVE